MRLLFARIYIDWREVAAFRTTPSNEVVLFIDTFTYNYVAPIKAYPTIPGSDIVWFLENKEIKPAQVFTYNDIPHYLTQSGITLIKECPSVVKPESIWNQYKQICAALVRASLKRTATPTNRELLAVLFGARANELKNILKLSD